jgi:hypothetical protein
MEVALVTEQLHDLAQFFEGLVLGGLASIYPSDPPNAMVPS